MGLYRIADRVFDITTKYNYTTRLCADYLLTDTSASVDYTVAVTDGEILAEKVNDADRFSEPYLESLAIYRKITGLLIADDCFLMHAAVIAFDGKAYAFTAKSGMGKTTHTELWKKVYGEKVTVINGDKPLIRRINKGAKVVFIAYGTPWCGKEKQNTNTSAPLAGICLLERSKFNNIELASDDAVPFLLGQLLIRGDDDYLDRLLDLLGSLVETVPIYRLKCNISEGAAITACCGMCGD